MPLIYARNLSFRYNRRMVLHHVSLAIRAGDIVCLLGPNGSGKTTLLKLLMGLYPPLCGTVRLEGQDISAMPARQLALRMAYVPQIHRHAFAYRVLDVVLMGRLPHKPFLFTYSPKDRHIAETALSELGISHLKHRPYTDISGGERQLTLIARAMAQGADIFIMDEPVSGLDYGNQIRLLQQIDALAAKGYTFIKTTHFPEHALWVSNRVVMLKSGRILADGPTASVVTRENLYRLYQTPIQVNCMCDGIRVCMPEAMGAGRWPPNDLSVAKA